MPEKRPSDKEKSDIYDGLVEREIRALVILLATKAQKTSLTLQEFIQTRLIAGASLDSIEQQLTDDLLNNGRMFSEFRSAVKSTAIGSANKVRDAGYVSSFGIDTKYRWSAVLVNTCPDCLERHGQVKTWDEWEEIGLPRTGATVCRDRCHCVLIPSDFASIEPIKREKK